MNRPKSLSLFAGGLLLVCSGVAAQAQGGGMSDTSIYAPFNDPRSASAVVASVGPLSITAREFRLSYEFGPSFAKRRPDSKRTYLGFMIYEKLLALGARERGRQSDPQILKSLKAVEGDVATEELYKADILRKVRITEEEIQRAVRQERTTLNLRWLYAATKDQAEEWDRLLKAGLAFDTLFERQFVDTSVARADRMMEVTAFHLLQRNRPLAGITRDLPAGKPSLPIHTPDGWYIMQIDNIWRDVGVTESSLRDMRYNVRRALTQMKADSLSDDYVRNLMLRENPVIQRRTFDILRAYVGSKILTKDKFESWDLAGRFRTTTDSVEYTRPGLYARDTLVTLGRNLIRLGEFLEWYGLREDNLPLPKTSPEQFFLSLENLVWRLVRDKLLVDRARTRKFQNFASVALQKTWWEEKMLYQEEKDSIMKSISSTDSVLRSYYEGHLRHYRRQDGRQLRFEEVKEDVLRDWYDAELTMRMYHRIAELKSRYKVQVNNRTLERIEVDAENSPTAIEVYPVKKGGTFPHPAFPAIDHSWVSWN